MESAVYFSYLRGRTTAKHVFRAAWRRICDGHDDAGRRPDDRHQAPLGAAVWFCKAVKDNRAVWLEYTVISRASRLILLLYVQSLWIAASKASEKPMPSALWPGSTAVVDLKMAHTIARVDRRRMSVAEL